MLSLIQRRSDISYKHFNRVNQLEPKTGPEKARNIGATAIDVILALGALAASGLVVAYLGSSWGIALGIAGGAYLTVTVVVRMIPRASRPTDRYGNTELHHAARNGDSKKVLELIRKGAEVEVRDNTGQTPLRQALRHRVNGDVVNLLIDALVDKEGETEIDEISEHSVTLFATAIMKDYGKEVLEKLMTENNKTKVGHSAVYTKPINYAYDYKNQDAIDLLEKEGVEPPKEDSGPVYIMKEGKLDRYNPLKGEDC